jgi:hypothetical protein
VSGVLRDGWERPLPGVRVSLDAAVELTDGDGRYAFLSVDVGRHQLRLRREGYRFAPEHEPHWTNEDFVGMADDDAGWLLNVWRPGQVLNFYGFATRQLRPIGSAQDRLHPREPEVGVGSLGGGDFYEYCQPCKVFEVAVERSGHLFIRVAWTDDMDLALWVEGLRDPNVGRRRLVRDIPVTERGLVVGYLGRSSKWGGIDRPVDMVIETYFVSD